LVLLALPFVWAVVGLPGGPLGTAAATPDVSFIAFGDSGTASSAQLALRDQMVSHAADYDMAVLVGDGAYPSGAYTDYTTKLFNIYGGLFQSQNQALPAPTRATPKPLYPTPGNHDYEIDKTAAGYFNSFILPTNGPGGVPAEKFYTYNVGSVHFVSFDSHYLVGFDMSTPQAEKDAVRDWLIADLDTHVSQVTVVYDHHPAYTAGPHHGEQEESTMRSAWFSVFAAHGVDLFLSGHDHSYQRNTPQSGLTSYVLGTGGGALTDVTPQTYTAASLKDYGYLNVSVTGCTISTSLTRSSGATYDPWTFAAPTCSSGPATGQLFADGFETGDYSAWSTVQVGVGGNASVQSTTVKAGSFSAALSATTAAGSYAYARKNLAAAQLTVLAGGDFRVVAEGAAGANVPLIRLFNETGTRILSLYRQNASGSKLYVQHSGLYNTTTGVLPLGTWGRLEVKVRVNGSSSTVEVRLNGALIHQTASANLAGSGVLRIQIGNDTASQAFSLLADDITVSDGSDVNPLPSPSASPSPSPSPSASPSASSSASPSATPSASPSASPSHSPSPSPGGGTILSDGFESGGLASWTARAGTSGITEVQSSVVKAGSYAARLEATSAGGSYAYIRGSLGAPRTVLTATADLRLATEGPTGANVPLVRLFDATGNRAVNVFRQNQAGNRVYVVYNGVTFQTTGTMVLNTWTAVGVRVVVAGASSTVQVTINGTSVYSTTSANLGTSGLTTIQYGNDTRKQPFQLFVDNVLVREL
jgi:hypothetical protein